MNTPPTRAGTGTVGTATTWIVILGALSGLTGLVGSFVEEGSDAQIILYSLASIGGLGASALLAVRHVRAGRDLAAAGFGALAIVTAAGTVAGFAGDGSNQIFMSVAILWLPALWMVAAQDWAPVWSRAAAAVSGLAFALYGYTRTLGDEGPDAESPLLMVAWATFIVALVGWILTVKDED